MGIETALCVAAGATVLNTAAQLKGASEERKAARARQRIESRRNQRQQLAQVRQAQVVRAQGAQQAATTGTLDSSGFRGSQASTGATVAGNLAFSQQIQGLQTFVNERLESAQKFRTAGQVVQAVGQAYASAAGSPKTGA